MWTSHHTWIWAAQVWCIQGNLLSLISWNERDIFRIILNMRLFMFPLRLPINRSAIKDCLHASNQWRWWDFLSLHLSDDVYRSHFHGLISCLPFFISFHILATTPTLIAIVVYSDLQFQCVNICSVWTFGCTVFFLVSLSWLSIEYSILEYVMQYVFVCVSMLLKFVQNKQMIECKQSIMYTYHDEHG